MLPLFGVRRFGQPSSMVEPLPSGLINPMGLGGTPLNHACFSFTGSNYASIAALSGMDPSNGYSVFFWAKAGELTGTGTRAAWMMRTDDNNTAFMPVPASGFANAFYDYVVDGTYEHQSLSAVSAAWVPFAISHVGNQIVTRMGPVKQTLTGLDVSARVGDTTELRLGGYLFGNNYIGLAANYIVWSGVIISDDMYADMIAAKSPVGTTGLVAWYPCPNTVEDARDMSGNGNHMTTTGGSLYAATGGPGLPWWPA
jgi:hypothetical protein